MLHRLTEVTDLEAEIAEIEGILADEYKLKALIAKQLLEKETLDEKEFEVPTMINDLTTIIEAIKADKLNHCDSIFATLGMWISQERMQCKAAFDFFDTVHIIPTKNNKSYNWMHGLFHKNFKQVYGQEYYIDERCDTKQGTADDVYFSRTLQRFTNSYVAPTVIINKPSSQASCTWANEKGTYDYPPTLYDKIDEYILETAEKNFHHHVNPYEVRREIVLQRNDYLRDLIKPYVPRSKKGKETEVKKAELF